VKQKKHIGPRIPVGLKGKSPTRYEPLDDWSPKVEAHVFYRLVRLRKLTYRQAVAAIKMTTAEREGLVHFGAITRVMANQLYSMRQKTLRYFRGMARKPIGRETDNGTISCKTVALPAIADCRVQAPQYDVAAPGPEGILPTLQRLRGAITMGVER